MNIERVLILSAGKGTRMGKLGEVLPKPLWPLGKTTLLEFQIKYWLSKGIKDIYINVFHQKEILIEYLKDFKNVHILEEPELLGVGGGIHNLARLEGINYSGNLLVSNVDVLCFDDGLLDRISSKVINQDACLNLFGTNNKSYREVCVKENKVVALEKSTQNDFLTYSGLSLIKLNSLKKVPGKSDFFKTICNFEENNIGVLHSENLEYWDFGTLERYHSSIYRLLTTEETHLKQALLDLDLYTEIKV